jgi:sulfoxide reductase catalytic subunit YedY
MRSCSSDGFGFAFADGFAFAFAFGCACSRPLPSFDSVLCFAYALRMLCLALRMRMRMRMLLQFTSWKNTTVSEVQGQYSDWPWPYVEGLTVAEARNDVAFMTVGLYQKVLPPQSGAPIRLTVPWKYGFKSIKSIRSIEFTDQIPVGFWEEVAYNEYGFWANVNPAQPHPRWSQATERELVTATYGNKLIPTEIWNGYGPFVAKMYEGPDFELLRATGRLYV